MLIRHVSKIRSMFRIDMVMVESGLVYVFLTFVLLGQTQLAGTVEDCHFIQIEQHGIAAQERSAAYDEESSCYLRCLQMDAWPEYCKAVEYSEAGDCSLHFQNREEAGSAFQSIDINVLGRYTYYEKVCEEDQGDFRTVVFQAEQGRKVNGTALRTTRVDSQIDCAQLCQKLGCHYFHLMTGNGDLLCEVYPLIVPVHIVADPTVLLYSKSIRITPVSP